MYLSLLIKMRNVLFCIHSVTKDSVLHLYLVKIMLTTVHQPGTQQGGRPLLSPWTWPSAEGWPSHSHPPSPKLDTAIRHWVAVVVLVCGHSAPMDQAIVVVVVHHGGIVFQLLIHDSTVRRLNQPLVKLFCESNQLGPGISAHYIIFFFTQKFLLWDVHGHSLSMLWKIFTIIQVPEITPILSPSVKWPSYFLFLQQTR